MRRPFTTMTVAVLAAAALAGCGGNDGDNTSADGGGGGGDGKQLFVEKCGSCHTLSDAGTSGTSGPSLDGLALDAERVKAQIEAGGGMMPPNLYEGEEADAVAEYVAEASQ